MEFREWMRETRKRKHLSQGELAKMAGLSQTAISWIERGKAMPYKRNQRKITAALNAAPDRLEMPVYAVREPPGTPAPAPEGGQTNGDMLRRMDDEELVFHINCPIHECKIRLPDRDCYQCKLGWLSEKAKGKRDDE